MLDPATTSPVLMIMVDVCVVYSNTVGSGGIIGNPGCCGCGAVIRHGGWHAVRMLVGVDEMELKAQLSIRVDSPNSGDSKSNYIMRMFPTSETDSSPPKHDPSSHSRLRWAVTYRRSTAVILIRTALDGIRQGLTAKTG